MSDDDAAAGQQEKKQLLLQRIYLKDASLEAPEPPDAFAGQWRPEIKVDLDTQVSQAAEDRYQVVLRVTVTAKVEQRTAFLVEVDQAGTFVVRGLSEQELGPVLGSYCPNTLFPFAREAVADLVARAGFPQLLLSPVNFDALYVQRLRQRQQDEPRAAAES